MSDAAARALVSRIVGHVPELRTLLARHMRDNFGEILPHVFFPNIREFVERCMAATDSKSQNDAGWILAQLESAMGSGDADVMAVVSVSFLEDLNRGAPGYVRLREALGPRLRKELAYFDRR